MNRGKKKKKASALEEMRVILCLTQKELAEFLNAQRTMVNMIALGKRELTASITAQLHHFSGLEAEWRKTVFKVNGAALSKNSPVLQKRLNTLKISKHHAQIKLDRMRMDYETNGKAIALLYLLKSNPPNNGREKLHAQNWITRQIKKKEKVLLACGPEHQAMVEITLAGIEAETEMVLLMMNKTSRRKIARKAIAKKREALN